nr:hypothetical protein [Tanacetum cinerariifolium]
MKMHRITSVARLVLDGRLGLLEAYVYGEVYPERGFLSQKGSGGGRGVKEKNKDVDANDDVSPSMTVRIVVMEKQSSLVDTSVPTAENMKLCLYPPLPMQGSSPAVYTLGMSSYANVTGNTLNPDDDLIKKDIRNVSVWFKLHGVHVMAFSKDGLSAIATKIGTSSMLDSYTSDMCLQSWGRSSYARAMIELWADEKLKDTIMVAMSRITRKGYYRYRFILNMNGNPIGVHVVRILVIQEECPKNI